MKRAYSAIEIKEFDEERRTFKGVASTPSADRMGDVVEPKGAQFKLPIPLLWQHDSKQPIGWITAAKITDKGIDVEGEVANIPEKGALKWRLDEAWQALKYKLVRGLSIGFNPIEYAQIDNSYGLRFLKWEWLELSAVTIPANQDASILTIKSIDRELRAAFGRDGASDPSPPGVSGTQTKAASGRFFYSRKESEMKTLKELQDEREAKATRAEELIELRKSEGRKSTAEEAAEIKSCFAAVEELDGEIEEAQLHEIVGKSARAVHGKTADEGSRSRGPTIIVRKQDPDDAFPGQSYTRWMIAKALSAVALKSGEFLTAADVAQHRWGKTHPKLVQFIKTGVAGGGTGSGEWGAELADSNTRFTGDFIEYLYGMTVFDRLPLRSVPARVHIKGQDGAATAYWVGESKSTPVSKPDFSDVELTPLKVSAIAVCSKELLADSSPSAEMWIRDSIAQASAQRVDTTFLSETAASSGVSPAGILNGVTAIASAGTDAAAVRTNAKALYRPFISAKNVSGLVYVMNPIQAKAMSLLVNALGQYEFPELNAGGGKLLGDTVYTGDNVDGNDIILMKPSDIWKIGDSGIEVSMSDQATIEQDDSPAGASDTPVAQSATPVSMFQSESVAFKVVRRINYAKRRSDCVQYIGNADFDGVES